MDVLCFLLLAQIEQPDCNVMMFDFLWMVGGGKEGGALNVCPRDHWRCHMFNSLVTCVVQMMPFTFPGTLNEGHRRRCADAEPQLYR